jgi:ATP-dependent RNA helicase DDX5/DBP2
MLLPGSITIEVGGALATSGRANQAIEQRVLFCDEGSKLSTLISLLEEELDEETRLIVFASSKRRVDDLTRALRVDGWPALGIHGDKPQDERDWVMAEFKTGKQPLLIATDVAQRGLDIKAVRCVINFDCPGSGEAYVHRIGRTGRAGSTGSACTLLTPEDARVAGELIRVLRSSDQPVPVELEKLAATAPKSGRRAVL